MSYSCISLQEGSALLALSAYFQGEIYHIWGEGVTESYSHLGQTLASQALDGLGTRREADVQLFGDRDQRTGSGQELVFLTYLSIFLIESHKYEKRMSHDRITQI